MTFTVKYLLLKDTVGSFPRPVGIVLHEWYLRTVLFSLYKANPLPFSLGLIDDTILKKEIGKRI